MRTSSQLSRNQWSYLSYIAAHPGCCAADVDRACRRNPNAGHKWVYDSVARLRRRGFLAPAACATARNGFGLTLSDYGRAKLASAK